MAPLLLPCLHQSGFVPACRRCRFLANFWLDQFVDKTVPEPLLLD